MKKLLALLLITTQAFATSQFTADSIKSRSTIVSSGAATLDSLIVTNSGSVGKGSAASTKAILDLVSTTKAFLPPRMTTTQKNAITSPDNGSIVYDTSLSSLQVYASSAWVAAGGGGITYAADTGSANAYAIAPTTPALAYTTGDMYAFKTTNANTTSSTLNVSALGTKNIKTPQVANLPANAIISGAIAIVVYDGTQFQLVNQQDPTRVSPLTTKGDVHVFSTVNARQAVGADFKPWIADSSQTNGVRYGDLSEIGSFNLAKDPGFESAAITTNWTASGGTFIQTTTAGQYEAGAAAASWDSSSAAQTFVSTNYAVPASNGGAASQAMVASCAFKCASGTCTHTITADDGSGNNFATATAITSTTSQFARTSVNFLAPASGNIRLKIASVASDEPIVYVDDCYLGLAAYFNIANLGFSTAPTVQKFTSSTGTYTLPTSPVVAYIRVRMVGGGGGGGGSGSAGGSNGGTGGNSTFGTTLLVANGGVGGLSGPNNSTGGAGGTASLGSGPIGTALSGGAGAGGGGSLATNTMGGSGAPSPLGGAGGGDPGTSTAGTVTAITNSGSGGGGGGQGTNNYSGGGGGAGGWVDAFISSPSATYSYAIGAAGSAGSAGTNGSAGGAGGSGYIEVTEYYALTPQMVLRPDQTPASWSGYHDNDCSWSRTSASYGDPTADATCTFTEKTNRNFGTVTSYLSAGNKLPGFVWTPPRIARYFVAATISVRNSAAVANASYKLWDGTTGIDEKSINTETSQSDYRRIITLQGIYNVASVASTTISIQTQSTSSANVIDAAGSIGTAVSWTIFELDAPMPTPLLQGSVLSSSSGVEYVQRATLTCGTASSIARQTGSWLSIANGTTGNCTGTMTGFSAAPTCTCTPDTSGSGKTCSLNITSSTAFTVARRDSAAAAENGDVHIICMGPK